jgi:hypothetical protein
LAVFARIHEFPTYWATVLLKIRYHSCEPSPGLKLKILFSKKGRIIWISIRRYDQKTTPKSNRKIQRYLMYDAFSDSILRNFTDYSNLRFERPWMSAARVKESDGVVEIENAEGYVFVISLDEIKAILKCFGEARNMEGPSSSV